MRVTGSLSHGSQPLVNTTPTLRWSAVEHFLECRRSKLIWLNAKEEYSNLAHYPTFSIAFSFYCPLLCSRHVFTKQLFSSNIANTAHLSADQRVSLSPSACVCSDALQVIFAGGRWSLKLYNTHQQNLNGSFLLR